MNVQMYEEFLYKKLYIHLKAILFIQYAEKCMLGYVFFDTFADKHWR